MKRHLLFTLILILSITCQLRGGDLRQELTLLIQSRQYGAVGSLLCTNYNSAKLQKVAVELDCQPLLSALKATKQFFSEKHDLGITPGEFLQAAFYILTELPQVVQEGNYYLTKEHTMLSTPLEFDPASGKTFILLDGYKEAFLGLGGKKTVYKAICFDEDDCKVVARGEQYKPMDNELKMYKLLQGSPGLIATGAVTTHAVDGKTYTALYSDLYHPGSLTREVFKGYSFSTYEKARIMLGILTGLDSLHSRNVVHRDLHAQNYFLNIVKGPGGKRKVEAVIADLGRTLPVDEVQGVVVQGSVKCIAPEGFLIEKMKGKDYFFTDIFAAGCVFYKLFYEKMPPWIAKEYFKDKTVSREEKSKFVTKELKKATEKRRDYLHERKAKEKISPKEELELLILQMVHVDPAERGSAKILKMKTENLVKKLKS